VCVPRDDRCLERSRSNALEEQKKKFDASLVMVERRTTKNEKARWGCVSIAWWW
jgi:hypothetical protein